MNGALSSTALPSKYLLVRNLVPDRTRSFLHDYAVQSLRSGRLQAGDATVPDAPCCYADPLMEWLLEALLTRIEGVTGASLYPTYSYLRIYSRNDVLKRHTDRPSCEISVTLSLGYDSEKPWPLWIDVEGESKNIQLARGDALVYRGIEVPHWREPFSGNQTVQLFLHYVERTGAHSDRIFDRRAQLAISPAARRVMEAVSRASGLPSR